MALQYGFDTFIVEEREESLVYDLGSFLAAGKNLLFDLRTILFCLFVFWNEPAFYVFWAGLGNVRPAGHMQPAKHLNVARELCLKFSN